MQKKDDALCLADGRNGKDAWLFVAKRRHSLRYSKERRFKSPYRRQKDDDKRLF